LVNEDITLADDMIMKNILIWLFISLSFFSNLTRAEDKRELRVTLQSSLISLDPGGIQDSASQMVSRQVNCQLVRSQGSVFVLDAAESIKYITPREIILKLNNKVKFHDGSSVTAEDVLASFNYIKASRNILQNLYVWIDKMEAVDDKTVKFTLKKHVPQLLKVLSGTNFNIFKKDFLYKAKKDKNLWKNPMGCGGYKVVESNNDYVKLIPVTTGLPITFYLIKSNLIALNDMDKYDIITADITAKENELDKVNFKVLKMFDPVQFYIGLNSHSKMWKNRSDRCRFLAELDLKNLINSYGDGAVPANDILPKGTLGYSENRNFNDQIIDISNKVTQAEVNKKSNPFCFAYLSISVEDKYKVEYLKMLKKIYPNIVTYPIFDTKKYGKDFVNKNCDAIVFAWKSYYLDGYEYLTFFENNDANFSSINNENLSNRILKSQDIESASDRAKEYQNIIREIGDLCIVRPLFTLPTRKIYMRKDLKAPGIGLVSIHQYYLGNISR
jgi:ABC-type transport system substrate-binding protein